LKQFKDVAKEFRVSIATVSMLVSKARKKPEFIKELFSKQELKQLKYSEVE
jgi:transposase